MPTNAWARCSIALKSTQSGAIILDKEVWVFISNQFMLIKFSTVEKKSFSHWIVQVEKFPLQFMRVIKHFARNKGDSDARYNPSKAQALQGWQFCIPEEIVHL